MAALSSTKTTTPCPLPVAILAGGLATRLRPLTETIPKALVPVLGKPFLSYQLTLLQRYGVKQVVLCVGHLGEKIEAVFGDGLAYGVRLHYSWDGPELLGTGGALRHALPELGNAFLVLYGDSYLEIDYATIAETFLKDSCPALMTVIENVTGPETCNVWFEQGKLLAYDKRKCLPQMRYLDYGLHAYRAKGIAQNTHRDLSDLQSQLVAEGQMAGYEVTVPYYEIGSHEGLAALENHLRKSP